MAQGSQNMTSYQANKWTNLRTFTIGLTGHDVDGTGAVSWTLNQILGTSTNAYFFRGDKTWSNTLENNFYLNGHLYLDSGKHIYMKYSSTDWPVLNNHNNGNISVNGAGSHLDLGYFYTPVTRMYYTNSDNTVRTQFFEINSNGAYALTRFGVNGQDTNYRLYVNGTSYFTGVVSVPSALIVRAQDSAYEGGEICLAADPNHSEYDANLDVYNNYFRIHSNGSARFSVNLTNGNIQDIGTITGHYTKGTTTSDATGAILLCPAISSNTGIFNGNGDGPGDWNNVANLIIKSWYGVGFVDGCTSKGMTVGIDCRTGNIRMNGSLYIGKPTTSGTGIYWNAYVESASDASDASAIYQIIGGVAGGTELRISQANDNNDVINLVSPAYIYLNSKRAFQINDSWLRINEGNGFSSGVYFGSSLVRTDGELWSDSIRLVDNWVGFYNSVQGGTRYGYIQANADRMCFRKENGVNGNLHFDFSGNIYNSGEFVSGTSNGVRIRNVILRNDGSNFYFLVGSNVTPGDNWNSLRPFYWNLSNGYCYHTRAYNAVWNDYAEFRKGDTVEPGYCVIETSSGIMTKSTSRLQPGAKMISDTYGEAMGETKEAKTPIAVSGRMLAYTYRNRNEYYLGAAVCSAPGGTIDIMTREEIMMYPERIVGTVSEIPDYDIWNSGGSVELGPSEEIQVNGRIWIYVR